MNLEGRGINDGNGAGIESAVAPSPPRYQKLGSQLIRPLVLAGEHCAFDLARLYYARVLPKRSFEEDLIDYCRHGFVAIRPTVFGMVKPIEHDGRRGWFIQMAVGSLLELLTTLPCRLDFIAFDRDDSDNLRIVEFDAFIKRASRKLIGNGRRHGRRNKDPYPMSPMKGAR